jgi:hypothetical protein
MDGMTDGRSDGWINGQTDEWMDGLTDGYKLDSIFRHMKLRESK